MTTLEGDVSELTLELLRLMRGESLEFRREANGRFGDANAGLAEVRAGLAELRALLREVRTEAGELRAELRGPPREVMSLPQASLAALLDEGDQRFFELEGRLKRLEEQADVDPERN
jgi:hypothetical protein